MKSNSKDLGQMIKKITKPWSPVEIARANGQVVWFALFRGEYHWHLHPDGDEMFFVFKGAIEIQVRNGKNISLKAGMWHTVPKGTIHCPRSSVDSYVVMVEPENLKSESALAR